MKILLLTAKAPKESPFFTAEKRPPVGLLSLAASIRENGHQVSFIDNYTKPVDCINEAILGELDYVGIYCNTICWRDCLDMIYKIHHLKVMKKVKCKVVLGGPHVSVNLASVPLNFVDHVVQGEGEKVIVDILNGKETSKVIKAARITDLDSLPMPAYYLVRNNINYNWDMAFMPEKPVYPMNTSRGCPYPCTFCSVSGIWGKQYIRMSAKAIYAQMKVLVENFGAKGIYFREDNFTSERNRVKAFCDLLIKRPLNVPWVCESRVDGLTKGILEKMKKAGCVGVYIGVETGSKSMLKILKKNYKVHQIKNIFRYCRELGIKTACSLIVGTPGENQQDIEDTKALMSVIKPTIIWDNVYVGLPGSELYDKLNDSGNYELKDDRGLIYLKGHNDRVLKHYGNHPLKKTTVVPAMREDAPLVSVVMSAYNVENYVELAIQSILRQSYQNFEFLIVDDCSTDGTLEAIKRIKDPRIRVFENKMRCGLTKNLNNLIKTAKGMYIARMDADDISLEPRFEKQLDFLRRNNCVAVGTTYYHINDSSRVTNFINLLCTPESIADGLKRQNWFAHGSLMFERKALMAVGIYDEFFIYTQDYDLFVRLVKAGYRIANLEVPYYSYRVRADNISNVRKAEQAKFAEIARRKMNG